MFGHSNFPAFQGAAPLPPQRAYPQAPQPAPQQPVMDQSLQVSWNAHHAGLDNITERHAGTVNPGFFSVAAPRPEQNSPLRFVRSTLDYSQMILSPVVGRQHLGNVHQVLTQQGYPSGMVLVVNPSNRSNDIPREIERLAAMSEQGIPVPEIISYGTFNGHAALLMRENAPLYAATRPMGNWGQNQY